MLHVRIELCDLIGTTTTVAASQIAVLCVWGSLANMSH